jgi:mannose-6-phosphate isomerase-like protein (cupin superfamily)
MTRATSTDGPGRDALGGAAFQLDELRARQPDTGGYLEFLRVPSLSVGVYALRAGAADPQQPHTEDEVYVVTAGQATLRVADVEHPVGPGSVVFVPALVDHRFHDITEDMTVLVLFAPAEYSQSDQRDIARHRATSVVCAVRLRADDSRPVPRSE